MAVSWQSDDKLGVATLSHRCAVNFVASAIPHNYNELVSGVPQIMAEYSSSFYLGIVWVLQPNVNLKVVIKSV